MDKAIYFDMDGTIADLYNQPDWLPKLRAENPAPYADAELMVDAEQFQIMVNELKRQGYLVGVISWSSREATDEYTTKIREVKTNWLTKHFGNIFDEIHVTAYGVPKHSIPKHKQAVLVDDNSKIRKEWSEAGGIALDARFVNFTLQLLAT